MLPLLCFLGEPYWKSWFSILLWQMGLVFMYCPVDKALLYLYCDERMDLRWNIAWAWKKSQGLSPMDFLRAQAIFHCISRLESQYRYSQFQLQHWLAWEINIGRVDSPYCSDRWEIRENIGNSTSYSRWKYGKATHMRDIPYRIKFMLECHMLGNAVKTNRWGDVSI